MYPVTTGYVYLWNDPTREPVKFRLGTRLWQQVDHISAVPTRSRSAYPWQYTHTSLYMLSAVHQAYPWQYTHTSLYMLSAVHQASRLYSDNMIINFVHVIFQKITIVLNKFIVTPDASLYRKRNKISRHIYDHSLPVNRKEKQ